MQGTSISYKELSVGNSVGSMDRYAKATHFYLLDYGSFPINPVGGAGIKMNLFLKSQNILSYEVFKAFPIFL